MDWHRRLGVGGSRRIRRLEPRLEKGKNLPEELRKVKLYTSPSHQQNFLDCIKTRQPTITPVQVGHHSAIPGHLCLISMLTGRKIRWDVKDREDHRRSRSQQADDARIPCALENELEPITGSWK
jgi:hypothetical protein